VSPTCKKRNRKRIFVGSKGVYESWVGVEGKQNPSNVDKRSLYK
jgi:hypothetical protein